MLALGIRPVRKGNSCGWLALETLAWWHVLVYQWLPWIIPYAMEDTHFVEGLALGVAMEGTNMLLSYALFRVGYLQAFPKMVDISFMLSFVPLLIASYTGGVNVASQCWRWFQLVVNSCLAATFLVSVCLPNTPALSVMEQYMRDLEGGPPHLFRDRYWIQHNYWLNVIWLCTMCGMAAAAAVVGVGAHTDGAVRTLDYSAWVAQYPVQCSVFALGVILNISYTAYMRPKYRKCLHSTLADVAATAHVPYNMVGGVSPLHSGGPAHPSPLGHAHKPLPLMTV